MGISDISYPFTSFGCIRARKCHHLDAGVHHIVQDRRDYLLIGDIYTDHVKIPVPDRKQSLLLVFGGCCFRSHVLVCDGYALIQKLPLGILHTESHCIPPGMDYLVCKIEIIMILFRLILIELMVKIHGTAHCILRSWIFFDLIPGRTQTRIRPRSGTWRSKGAGR